MLNTMLHRRQGDDAVATASRPAANPISLAVAGENGCIVDTDGRFDRIVAAATAIRPACSATPDRCKVHRPPGQPAVVTPSPLPTRWPRLEPMLRIALLDDHPAVLAGLRRLIDAEPDLSVAAVAATAPELATKLNGLRPDVLILDYDLARDDGLTHLRRIKSRTNPPAVVVYSAYAGPALNLAARAAQADAVVDKAEPVQTLLTAVRRAANGDVVMAPVPRDAFEAAVARLEDDDLPVFAMLLDREPLDSIADVLRVDQAEVNRRAQRIVGRLRPRRSVGLEDDDVRAPKAWSR